MPAGQRLLRWSRREPLKASLAALGLLAVSLFGYVLITGSARKRGQAEQTADRVEYMLLEATLALHTRSPAERKKLLDEALALQPDDPHTVLVVVVGRMRSDPKEALALLDQHGGSTSTVPALRRLRARLLQLCGSAEAATALPEPADALDHYLAGEFALQEWAKREPDAGERAMQHMRRAVLLAPRPRALYYIGLNRAARAIQDSFTWCMAGDALVQHWPGSAAAHAHRALAWNDVKDAVRTREAAERSLQLSPDNFIGLSTLAEALRLQGDEEQAERLEARATELHPASAEFLKQGRSHAAHK